ncbi:MAG: ABC transporter ATP-binding protein [Veillonellaceae bacterium]|nr:ABC transporter ATP-binding protein [Veillonellaceae bacterium]
MITIRNLSFARGAVPILHDISLEFSPGKVTGIVGPNGCGKSTLLHHISKLLPTRGQVFVDGTDVATIGLRDFARTIAILTQRNGSMTDEFLVEDIVLMGRYPHKERFTSYSLHDREICAEMMERTGITHFRYKKMGELSGGERQRVYIAKALAQEPQVLLLDEPTNHLDIRYKIQLMEQLRTFAGTVIVVLHDIGLAARYCDEAVLMEAGRIVSHGAAREILNPAQLQTVFGVEFRAETEGDTYYLYY